MQSVWLREARQQILLLPLRRVVQDRMRAKQPVGLCSVPRLTVGPVQRPQGLKPYLKQFLFQQLRRIASGEQPSSRRPRVPRRPQAVHQLFGLRGLRNEKSLRIQEAEV